MLTAFNVLLKFQIFCLNMQICEVQSYFKKLIKFKNIEYSQKRLNPVKLFLN